MTHITIPRLRAVAFGLLFPLLALPNAAVADGCTPVTSTASPVTNSTVTCTGLTQSQNVETVPFNFDAGYGTFNETGDTINVQSMASVNGLSFGFALGDGNTVNNSGLVTGGGNGSGFGIITTTGSTITVNNLTTTSTVSGTGLGGVGLVVTNVVVGNAGTISGDGGGIRATGSVTLSSNTGSITGTGSDSSGITANSVSGSNAGTISGAVGINVNTGSDVSLTSNSGTIQGNGGFAISAGGNVFIDTNSGTIASDGLGTGVVRTIDAGGSVTITNTGNIIATNAYGLRRCHRGRWRYHSRQRRKYRR